MPVIPEFSFFSRETNRFYKLILTSDWPTFSISSVPMHKLASPKKDTEAKIRALKPRGYVLDTCMGLGYTAIMASRLAEKVVTFERDDNVFILAKRNPFSEDLFKASNIDIRKEDVSMGIGFEKDSYFDCIIHDPPTFTLAGELFSQEFYSQLMRVLKKRGKLFHYTPLYKIRQGFNFPSKVKGRLQKCGFKSISYSKEACGLLCRK